jgi:hypothetical protein
LIRCREFNPDQYWCSYDEAWLRDEAGDRQAAVANFRRFLKLILEFECLECREEAEEYLRQNS